MLRANSLWLLKRIFRMKTVSSEHTASGVRFRYQAKAPIFSFGGTRVVPRMK